MDMSLEKTKYKTFDYKNLLDEYIASAYVDNKQQKVAEEKFSTRSRLFVCTEMDSEKDASELEKDAAVILDLTDTAKISFGKESDVANKRSAKNKITFQPQNQIDKLYAKGKSINREASQAKNPLMVKGVQSTSLQNKNQHNKTSNMNRFNPYMDCRDIINNRLMEAHIQGLSVGRKYVRDEITQMSTNQSNLSQSDRVFVSEGTRGISSCQGSQPLVCRGELSPKMDLQYPLNSRCNNNKSNTEGNPMQLLQQLLSNSNNRILSLSTAASIPGQFSNGNGGFKLHTLGGQNLLRSNNTQSHMPAGITGINANQNALQDLLAAGVERINLNPMQSSRPIDVTPLNANLNSLQSALAVIPGLNIQSNFKADSRAASSTITNSNLSSLANSLSAGNVSSNTISNPINLAQNWNTNSLMGPIIRPQILKVYNGNGFTNVLAYNINNTPTLALNYPHSGSGNAIMLGNLPQPNIRKLDNTGSESSPNVNSAVLMPNLNTVNLTPNAPYNGANFGLGQNQNFTLNGSVVPMFNNSGAGHVGGFTDATNVLGSIGFKSN